jgi:hypothetical protein
MEPPDLWVTRIPKRYHDVGPRVVRARGKTSIVDSEFLFVEDDEGTAADIWRYEVFETDYPHNDTNWPNSKAVADKATAGLDPETKEKVLRTNARRLFGLE